MVDDHAIRQPDESGERRIDGHILKKLRFGSGKATKARDFQRSRKLNGIRSRNGVDIGGVKRAMVFKMGVVIGGANGGTAGQTILHVAIGSGASDRVQSLAPGGRSNCPGRPS